VERRFQISQGKQPTDLANDGLDPSLVSICGKFTQASSLNRPCKDWIKCFSCDQMGHVARQCEAKWKKVACPNFATSFPKTSANKMSTTMMKIWIAKDADAGGAFGSNTSILDTLIESSKDIGEGLVLTILALTQQNPSSSSEPSSVPLPSP
jgi:hypothetical protein